MLGGRRGAYKFQTCRSLLELTNCIMNRILTITLFTSLLHSYDTFPILTENTELILVHVIFRHGERTTYKFYPSDPHKNNTFYPTGLGGLTNRGKLREYELGQCLRKHYDKFLGENYMDDLIEMRSTDVPRTKMSAQLVLAGLWPPSEKQKWHPYLSWQPIPIIVKSNEQEDLLNPTNCPLRNYVLENLLNDPIVQDKYIKPHQKLINYLEDNSGLSIKDIHDVLELYFILNTENDMNMTLPKWTQKIYPEPMRSVASLVYGYLNHDLRVRKINTGYLLKKILKDSEAKIRGELIPSNRKMFLYSGHETTIGYLLETLNIFEPHIPPYGSALILEVHKGSDDYFIKIRYRNSTVSSDLQTLVIPGCEGLCPLNEFIIMQNDVIPTISIEEACSASQYTH